MNTTVAHGLGLDPPAHSRTTAYTHGEPQVWGFENEHVHAPDLRSYLINHVLGRTDTVAGTAEGNLE